MVMPILTTKLHIPALRRNRVARERLLERLDQGLHRKLTLVSAPAGFGKTTLLGEWSRELGGGDSPRPRIAWISLDEGDNDPARFCAYLAAALGQADASLGQASGDPFELAGSHLQEPYLIALINRVAALPQAFVLVLDDYHLITAQAVHDGVAFLVDHLPQNLHLVLATRADPPLPLPRLRARGQLVELRQSDLRFTTAEAAAFLNDVMGLGLSAGDVAALEARTEGWIAGLQMASLAMQAPPSPAEGQAPDPRSEFVRAFTGSHRFVLDYLVEEVLEQQPPPLQEFLLQTSILERLAGSLCDWVTGNLESREWGIAPDSPISRFPNSQSVLEHLETANLFIIPLDAERRWYRYHRLFADLLRKRLGQRSPDLVPMLHRRASAWYEQAGLLAEAIDHALAGSDFERAASLIEGTVEATLMRSEVATFLHWVERLPEEALRRRPRLCFFHAWALTMSGRSVEVAERRLQDSTRPQEASEEGSVMAGRVAALHAYRTVLQGNMRRAAEIGRQALERLPETDLYLRSIMSWILSLARMVAGDLQDGSGEFKELASTSQEMGNPLLAVSALCYQATVQMRQGRLHEAREIFERALRWATNPQGRRLPIASEPLMGLARVSREWNQLEVAAGYLAESIELARQWSELAAFDAYIPLMRIRLAQGNVEAAREAVEIIRQLAHKSEITDVDDLLADLQHAYFCISSGDVQGATRWAEARGLIPGPAPEPCPASGEGEDFVAAHLLKYELLVLARLFLLQGQPAEALGRLEPLLTLAKQLGRTDLTIEIQILRALACQAEGRDVEAMAALGKALSLAEPGGYVRIFLDEGEPMARLLRQAALQGVAPIYAAKLLAAFAGPESAAGRAAPGPLSSQPLIEPLSERELEVLRLLAAGLSNPEIAGELVVAVSTVRSHCKNIYGKLNVHKRWDAVQRGQELELI